jgi:hypothetical protein
MSRCDEIPYFVSDIVHCNMVTTRNDWYWLAEIWKYSNIPMDNLNQNFGEWTMDDLYTKIAYFVRYDTMHKIQFQHASWYVFAYYTCNSCTLLYVFYWTPILTTSFEINDQILTNQLEITGRNVPGESYLYLVASRPHLFPVFILRRSIETWLFKRWNLIKGSSMVHWHIVERISKESQMRFQISWA